MDGHRYRHAHLWLEGHTLKRQRKQKQAAASRRNLDTIAAKYARNHQHQP